MKVRQGPARAALLCTAASAVLTLVTVGSASAATAPPYEPDPNAAGAIVFYDASGAVITSGSTSTLVGYAVGTATLTATGNKAALYGYLPKAGKATGAFSGELLAGPTTYPVSGAPTAVSGSANPAVKPTTGDLTFSDLAKDFPNTATDAYAGLYQIRTKTSDAKYLATDISISGSTWTQVYPAPAGGTSTVKPGVPTIGTATAGDGTASVSFTPPTDTGDSAITSYTVTSTPGGLTASGTTSPITVSGLVAGTSYTFTVHATNGAGSGPESAASNAVTSTSSGAPDQPTFKLGTNVVAAGQQTKLIVDGTPGDSIDVLVKGAASSTYSVIATIKPNAARSAFVYIHPSTTSSYAVRNAVGTAAPQSLLVKAVQSLVVKVSGHFGTFTGHIAPSLVGRTVLVYATPVGGHPALACSTKTTSGGQFRCTHTFKSGRYSLFAQTGADKYNAAGKSSNHVATF